MDKPELTESASVERISAIRAIPIALPLRRDTRWRGLTQSLGRWVLIRVETDAGRIGWGEATPLSDWGGDHGRYYGETPHTVVHVVEQILAPALAGLGIWEVEAAAERSRAVLRGHLYARAAVDIALWDLRGQAAEQPIYRLLGGSAAPVPVAHMLGLMEADQAVSEAQAAVAEGVQAFQIKLRGRPAEDRDIVGAIRDGVGPGILLRADLNGGYSSLRPWDAISAVEGLAAAGVDLVEQPVEGARALAEIRAKVKVPIVADESCWTVADAIELAALGAADAFSVYVAKAGGLAPAKRLAEYAEAHGIACDVNGSLESGIGTLASVHLAAACPGISLPAVLSCPAPSGVSWPAVAGRYYTDDVLASPVRFANGALHPPSGPGLGIEVDFAKVEQFAHALGTG